jgi:hypothetical protein
MMGGQRVRFAVSGGGGGTSSIGGAPPLAASPSGAPERRGGGGGGPVHAATSARGGVPRGGWGAWEQEGEGGWGGGGYGSESVRQGYSSAEWRQQRSGPAGGPGGRGRARGVPARSAFSAHAGAREADMEVSDSQGEEEGAADGEEGGWRPHGQRGDAWRGAGGGRYGSRATEQLAGVEQRAGSLRLPGEPYDQPPYVQPPYDQPPYGQSLYRKALYGRQPHGVDADAPAPAASRAGHAGPGYPGGVGSPGAAGQAAAARGSRQRSLSFNALPPRREQPPVPPGGAAAALAPRDLDFRHLLPAATLHAPVAPPAQPPSPPPARPSAAEAAMARLRSMGPVINRLASPARPGQLTGSLAAAAAHPALLTVSFAPESLAAAAAGAGGLGAAPSPPRVQPLVYEPPRRPRQPRYPGSPPSSSPEVASTARAASPSPPRARAPWGAGGGARRASPVAAASPGAASVGRAASPVAWPDVGMAAAAAAARLEVLALPGLSAPRATVAAPGGAELLGASLERTLLLEVLAVGLPAYEEEEAAGLEHGEDGGGFGAATQDGAGEEDDGTGAGGEEEVYELPLLDQLGVAAPQRPATATSVQGQQQRRGVGGGGAWPSGSAGDLVAMASAEELGADTAASGPAPHSRGGGAAAGPPATAAAYVSRDEGGEVLHELPVVGLDGRATGGAAGGEAAHVNALAGLFPATVAALARGAASSAAAARTASEDAEGVMPTPVPGGVRPSLRSERASAAATQARGGVASLAAEGEAAPATAAERAWRGWLGYDGAGLPSRPPRPVSLSGGGVQPELLSSLRASAGDLARSSIEAVREVEGLVVRLEGLQAQLRRRTREAGSGVEVTAGGREEDEGEVHELLLV